MRTEIRRAVLAAPLLLVVLAALVWAFSGVPDFGHYAGFYGTAINHVAVAQRHVSNVVASVVFDYRGFDTLGEEFILFTSATGVALLLRASREDEKALPHDIVLHDVMRAAGALLVPVVLLLGLWVITFGYVTPGGGFPGGVIVAGSVLLTWAAASYRDLRTFAPLPVVDAVEGLGAGSYVAIGLAGLGAGGYFLANVLPLGETGSLLSAGTTALLNWSSALAVAAANVLIFDEFLMQYVISRPRSDR